MRHDSGSFFLENMRKYTGKALSIVLDTNILRMLCERVISLQELTQFSQTKWRLKLKVVSFGRFGLSDGVDNTPIYFPKRGLRLLHKHIRYPAGLSGPDFFNYPANSVSGRIIKNNIRCTPRKLSFCFSFYQWNSLVLSISGPQWLSRAQGPKAQTPLPSLLSQFWKPRLLNICYIMLRTVICLHLLFIWLKIHARIYIVWNLLLK